MKSALSSAFLLFTCLIVASYSASTTTFWKPRSLQQSICSCSPQSFTVKLDYLQSCLDNTLESNAGISSPTECTIEVGDPDASARKLEDSISLGIATTNRSNGKNGYVEKNDLYSSNNLRDRNKYSRRQLQSDQSTTPANIISITFIELNALGTVINVDDQYSNGNFMNGSSISLQSISSTISQNIPIENQWELVPSTQVLFLEGVTTAGEDIRGRFVWNYTNSCASDAATIRQGDELAWVQFTQVEEQLGAICPANERGVPTLAPIDVMTLGPAKSPVTKQTILPSATPTVVEEPSPTIRPTEVLLETIEPTVMPTVATLDTMEPTPFPISLDRSPSPTSLGPTLLPTFAPIDTTEPISAPTTLKPMSKLTHASNNSIMMSMSMQQYYVTPQRSESSIENILDHFDVTHVVYNGDIHGKSRKAVKVQPNSNMASVTVKNHFDVIHVDDENMRSKSHKKIQPTVKIISKSGKNEKSSNTSSGEHNHNSIKPFASRSSHSMTRVGRAALPLVTRVISPNLNVTGVAVKMGMARAKRVASGSRLL